MERSTIIAVSKEQMFWCPFKSLFSLFLLCILSVSAAFFCCISLMFLCLFGFASSLSLQRLAVVKCLSLSPQIWKQKSRKHTSLLAHRFLPVTFGKKKEIIRIKLNVHTRWQRCEKVTERVALNTRKNKAQEEWQDKREKQKSGLFLQRAMKWNKRNTLVTGKRITESDRSDKFSAHSNNADDNVLLFSCSSACLLSFSLHYKQLRASKMCPGSDCKTVVSSVWGWEKSWKNVNRSQSDSRGSADGSYRLGS